MTRITPARGAVLGATLLSGLLLLTACSNNGGGASSSAAGFVHGTAAGAPAGPVPGNGAASSGRSAPEKTGAQAAGSAAETAHLALSTQSIIYTASVTMRTSNAVQAARQAARIVAAAGGYTSAEHLNSTKGMPGGTVSLTVKVPVTGYAQVLSELTAPALGKQLALNQQATDVTQQVADVNSLVASQEAAIAALRGLLRHAANVSQLLQVQQQISNDESYLESLQAQQRALARETSYATISMTLLTAKPAAHPHKQHKQGGFLGGLGAGWRALQKAASWLATALGAALPFLAIVAVLAGIGYAGRRRFTRRPAGPAGPTAAG